MARESSAPTGELKQQQIARPSSPMQELTIAEGRINGGIITSIDPADIPNGALQLAKNARVRFDKTSRRLGTSLITPAKPNANPVIGIIYFKKNNGSVFTLRLTRNSVHSRGGGWTAYTAGLNGSLLGADTDVFQATVAFDRLFITNNGVDEIQELDVVGNQYKRLSTSAGVSTKYRFLTSFYNRVVGANLAGVNPTQIGWSGDSNLAIWDNATDETAGQGPLIDSPSDLADFISGIFGMTNVMLVLREQSIWIATKNPIPSNPFNFYAAFPGIGCDCPYSACVTINAVCWLDTRTKAVWAYSPNGIPQRIGENVEKSIISAISNPNLVFSGFNPAEMEYHIGIPLLNSNYTRLWIYNFKTRTWVYDEIEGISEMVVAQLGSGILAISDLPGIISGLTGNISALTAPSSVGNSLLYGRLDGEIAQEDATQQNDQPYLGSSGQFNFDIISKDFELQEVDATFSRIRFELIPQASGTITIQYAKNGTQNWITAKSYTFQASDIGKNTMIKFVKQIRARRLTWRITATSGFFDLVEYEIKVYPSGFSKR